MSNLEAQGKVKRAYVSVAVIRADGGKVDLGVISDSARRWRYGPGRWLAQRRIAKANRTVTE